jgi:MFS family permease
VMSDKLAQRYGDSSRLYVALAAVMLGVLMLLSIMMSAGNLILAYALTLPFNFVSAMYLGPGASTITGLVDPGRRAVASAVYILMQVFLGTAMGPYVIGQLSDVFVSAGLDGGQALRYGILGSLLVVIPAVVFLSLANRHIKLLGTRIMLDKSGEINE